jgi:MscS family membrane protein
MVFGQAAPGGTPGAWRFVVCFLLAGASAAAQVSLPSFPSSPPASAGSDALGRTTPRGTVVGFLEACQSGRFHDAARYLEVPESRLDTQGPAMARQLQMMMDAFYRSGIAQISSRPDGVDEEGIGLDREVAGEMVAEGESIPLLLRRVDRPSGRVWLISAETLTRVAAVAPRVSNQGMLEGLPSWVHTPIYRVALWRWLGFVLLFIPALAAAAILRWALNLILVRAQFGRLPGSVTPLIGLAVHGRLIQELALPVLYRVQYLRFIGLAGIAGVAVALMAAVDRSAERLRDKAVAAGLMTTGSWIVIGRRILQALIVLLAFLLALAIFGFDLSTFLAGLGIGGIAVALAAQKTIENLFGGVSVASDQVFRVGDYCRFGTYTGTVTDIGLRSTRVRTLERVELSIPNGVLANMSIENFSARDKYLLRATLGVDYNTPPGVLRKSLAALQAYVENEPRIDSESRRVRLIDFSRASIDIEVFLYVLADGFEAFTVVREEILLRIMEILTANGVEFAAPPKTLPLGAE